MKIKIFLFLLAGIFVIGVIFSKPLITHVKVILFISEQFPQIPVVADLITPASEKPKPALILAMGVKTQEKDKVILLNFAQTLARLGYAVFWPRLEILDRGVSSFEDPETFIKSFEYLEAISAVDKNRISFVGFSVGSSIALVAAENPRINEKLHSLVFFGGYYSL
ncbi:MAG: hypothetical protein HYS68_02645, partial [Candidatus Levybacteria bacterium]|nr:hypothetical protein [Candidatus Levybacteria bacterium]